LNTSTQKREKITIDLFSEGSILELRPPGWTTGRHELLHVHSQNPVQYGKMNIVPIRDASGEESWKTFLFCQECGLRIQILGHYRVEDLPMIKKILVEDGRARDDS